MMTVIETCEFNRLILMSLPWSKLLPEHPTNHEVYKFGMLDCLVKACYYWPPRYKNISMKFQADNYAKPSTFMNIFEYSRG